MSTVPRDEKNNRAPRQRRGKTNDSASANAEAPRGETKKQSRGRRKPPDLEAKLDREIRTQFGRGPQDFEPLHWRGFRENMRLSLLYPGKYVAYRDHYENVDGHRWLAWREVICAWRTLMGLHNRLKRLAPGREDYNVGSVEPPEALPLIW